MDNAIHDALKMLCDTGNPEVVDEGFARLKLYADDGDMTAAAYVGYSCCQEHIGHYDLEMCKEYLDKSVNASDSCGQFFMGCMLLYGNAPFAQDTVYGKWLIEQAAAAGNEDAATFLKIKYSTMSDMEVISLYNKGRIGTFMGTVTKFFTDLFDKEDE